MPPSWGQVQAAVRWVRESSDGNLVVAMKSTVPPGTGRGFLQNELCGTGIGYAANPEFLRAGQALADWDCPDRIVIGTEPGDTGSLEAVRQLYSNTDASVLFTDITTEEMVKCASNALSCYPNILHERDRRHLRPGGGFHRRCERRLGLGR